MKKKSKYPLTGFSKITYEELLGIIKILKLFSSLSKQDQSAVNLMMDGLKFRSENKKGSK